MQQITPIKLKQRLDDGDQLVLLDIREAWEYEICHIGGSLNIPHKTLMPSLEQLDPTQAIVVICQHGIRAQQIAIKLKQNGFEQVFNLLGGIHHWALQVDPEMARY